MKMGKVGNQTNSQDPQAVNSRVFVGNLNTFQCSKTDVERMFQRYGRLAGISMHKGYAFVQFTNPFDARNACVGEDGRTVLGQILDVNMVAEPKPHQTGRNRQNVAKTGNDWDYYYDSYYSSTIAFPLVPASRMVPNLKRPRLSTPTNRSPKNGHSPKLTNNHGCTLASNDIPLRTYSNPDILICGNCRDIFSDLKDIINHKKNYCKLRFICRCDTLEQDGRLMYSDGTMTALICVQCKSPFPNAWDLMVHVQSAHMVNIYELGHLARSPARSDASSPIDSTSDKMDNGYTALDNGISTTNGSTEEGSPHKSDDATEPLTPPQCPAEAPPIVRHTAIIAVADRAGSASIMAPPSLQVTPIALGNGTNQ